MAEQDQVGVGQLSVRLKLGCGAGGSIDGEGFEAGGIDPRHLDPHVVDCRLQVVTSRTSLGTDQGRWLLARPIATAIWLGLADGCMKDGVEEGAFAGIGESCEDYPRGAGQEKSAGPFFLDLIELLGEAVQSHFDLLWGDERDIFIDEVETGFDIGHKFDGLLAQRVDWNLNTASQLPQRAVEFFLGLRVDDGQNGFALGQIESSGKECAEGEFSRECLADSRIGQLLEDRLEQWGGTDGVDFQCGLACVAERAGPEPQIGREGSQRAGKLQVRGNSGGGAGQRRRELQPGLDCIEKKWPADAQKSSSGPLGVACDGSDGGVKITRHVGCDSQRFSAWQASPCRLQLPPVSNPGRLDYHFSHRKRLFGRGLERWGWWDFGVEMGRESLGRLG